MKKIFARDFGVFPDTGDDMTEAVRRLFPYGMTDTEIIFDRGRYDFSAKFAMKRTYSLSNTTPIPERKLGILLDNMRGVTVDFGGSSLVFAGQMQPLTIDSCSDIEVKNAVIDWDKPLVGEGVVTESDDGGYTLRIDGNAFPHRFDNGGIYFDVGAGEEYTLYAGAICYDPLDRAVCPGTGDCIYIGKLEEIDKWLYRCNTKPGAYVPQAGCVLSLRHNERWHSAVFTENSSRVTLEDITVYSCGGLGCLSQFSEDLTFRRIHFTPNRGAGRAVTNGHDDGFHVTTCRGSVLMEQCSFVGLMDDPVNVHGCSVGVIEAVDSHTVRCRFMHDQSLGFKYWARRGDVIAFIDRRRMNCTATAVIDKFTPEADGYFTLTLADVVPMSIDSSDALSADNITATCSVTIRNCRFGSCRARGVLVSEPKPVLIENNLFDSSGSAILISGDCNGWFESGACRDVTIRGNYFSDRCLSSNYQFCEGVISICPVIPEPDENLPFHNNIKIIDNTFDTPGQPVLYAMSAEGLVFENNRVFRSYRAMPWRAGKRAVKLEYCVSPSIKNNVFVGFEDIADEYLEK